MKKPAPLTKDEEAQLWFDSLTDEEREALPAVRLRRLRDRAGLTAAVCARAADMTNATSWFVYENAKRMRNRKLPMKVIKPMLTLMVGRGTPRVTSDELIALSDIESIEEVRATALPVQHNDTKRTQNLTGVFQQNGTAPTLLKVRYRIEKSVYLSSDMIADRNLGMGPIAMSIDFRSEQSCGVVGDEDGGAEYPVGTVLHLVEPSEFVQHQLVGRKVVVNHMNTAINLGEVRLARVMSIQGNQVKMNTLRGEPIDGDILGVVVGKYARE